jgi:hypothetical protein
MAGYTDRVRLRCPRCEGSEWDLWCEVKTLNPLHLDPEGGINSARCPLCLVVSDQVVELNGEPLPR